LQVNEQQMFLDWLFVPLIKLRTAYEFQPSSFPYPKPY
jgi:hypothetical protein